jgi:2-oxoglutarate ferredoxin oxidoreductase subunit delta
MNLCEESLAGEALVEGRLSVVIDEQRCKGCGLCVEVCRKGLITLKDGLNPFGYHPAEIIHLDGCSGCGNCAMMCPEVAIEIYEEGLDEGK